MRPEPSTRRMPGSHHRQGGVTELIEPSTHTTINKTRTESSNHDNSTTATKTNRNTATKTSNISNRVISNSSRSNCRTRNDNINNNNSNSNSNNSRRKNGNSPIRLPSIREGKTPKRRTSSFSEVCTDLSTSQRRGSVSSNASTMSTQRRASVPQGTTSQPVYTRRGSKPTFAGIGRRVSSLVRYKIALQGRSQRTVPEDTSEENHMEPILQMPESPRFSSFMSPEAQYATMKGYEDKLYEKIADTNPEFKPCLQRTRTPHMRKITIVDKNSGKEQEGEEEKDEEGRDNKSPTSSLSTSGYGSVPSATSASSFSSSSASSSDVIKPLDNRSLSPESTTNTSTPSSPPISIPHLRPLRRQSMAATTSADLNGNGMMMMTANSQEDWSMHRSNSLPTLDPPGGLSHNKRLVLTYRLENAMDILDSLKKRNAENSLSPRVVRGLPWQVDAVKDFNSWTKVWNKEFKEAHK